MPIVPDKKLTFEERRTNRHILRYVPEWLQLRRITQHKVAERLSVSEGTVSKWLSGSIPMTIQNLAAIAALVDVSLIDILQSPQARLTQRESHEVLEIFAAMNRRDQEIYLAVGRSLADRTPRLRSAE